MNRASILVVIIVSYFFVISKFLGFFAADIYHTSSKKYLNNGEITRSLQYSHKAINKNPNEPSYYRQRSRALLASLVLKNNEEKQETKEEIYANLQKAENLNRKNLTTLRNIIPLYYFLSLKDIKSVSTKDNIDNIYLPVTENYYNSLKRSYPQDLGVLTDVAEYERKLFLEENYNDTIDQINNLRPDILDWHNAFN